MKPYVYPYKLGSHSAKALATALHTICVREQGMYQARPNHLVVNWGNPRAPKWGGNAKVLNPWKNLKIAQDKLLTFQVFTEKGISCPEWATSIVTAVGWLKAGSCVVQRNLLNSHSGNGINFVGYDEDTSTPIGVLGQAPLYTRYKKKAQEFRVHVFNGKVIDVQEKRKVKDYQGEANQYIRSHHTGWVYCREDIAEPHDLRYLAVAAIKALSLDFGAADIIYNKHEKTSYCLEVNTAPGLEGATVLNYAKAISQLCLQ